jgi:hypothetical protein
MPNQFDAGEEHDRRHRPRPGIVDRHAQRGAGVLHEHRRHRRERAGVIDHQQVPAEHEGDDQPERLAQVDVAAAGLRPPRAEFGVAQRADQRDRAADRPRRQQLRRRSGLPRDRRRRQEDAGSDHPADHDHRGVPGAEAAGVADGGRWIHAWRPDGVTPQHRGSPFACRVGVGVAPPLARRQPSFRHVIARRLRFAATHDMNEDSLLAWNPP